MGDRKVYPASNAGIVQHSHIAAAQVAHDQEKRGRKAGPLARIITFDTPGRREVASPLEPARRRPGLLAVAILSLLIGSWRHATLACSCRLRTM
jgi:hypothetical protein